MTTFTASTNDALRDRISDNLKQLFNCDAFEALKTCRAKRDENGKPCSRKSSSAYNGFCWQHFHRNKLFLLYGDGQLEKLESEELAAVDDLLKSMISNNKLAPTGPLAFPISRSSKDEWLDLMSRLLGWWFYDRDETFRQDFSSRALGIASLIVRYKCKKLKLMSGHPRILILVLWHLRLLHRPSYEDLHVELLDIDDKVIQFHQSLFIGTSWVSVSKLNVFELEYEADCVVYLNFCGLTANGQQSNPVEEIGKLLQALNPRNDAEPSSKGSSSNDPSSINVEKYTPMMLSFSIARGALKKKYETKIRTEMKDGFITRKVSSGRNDFVTFIIQRFSEKEKGALDKLQRMLKPPRIFPSANEVELCVLFSVAYMKNFLKKRGHGVSENLSKDKLIPLMMKYTTKSDLPAIPLLTIEAYEKFCSILLTQEAETSRGNGEKVEEHGESEDNVVSVEPQPEETTLSTPSHRTKAKGTSSTGSIPGSKTLIPKDENTTPRTNAKTRLQSGSEKPSIAKKLFEQKKQDSAQ